MQLAMSSAKWESKKDRKRPVINQFSIYTTRRNDVLTLWMRRVSSSSIWRAMSSAKREAKTDRRRPVINQLSINIASTTSRRSDVLTSCMWRVSSSKRWTMSSAKWGRRKIKEDQSWINTISTTSRSGYSYSLYEESVVVDEMSNEQRKEEGEERYKKPSHKLTLNQYHQHHQQEERMLLLSAYEECHRRGEERLKKTDMNLLSINFTCMRIECSYSLYSESVVVDALRDEQREERGEER